MVSGPLDAPASPAAPVLPGPLELLVLQPTPFCNINCSYCYLPDRQSTRRMSLDTLDQTFRWVFDSGLAREPFVLLWHAGEPLVLPVSFYETAEDLLRRRNVANVPVLQSFQTNATLLDASWCEFLRRPGYHLGVSVDGPDFLYDRYRRTRQGRGTLDRVLQGIQLLHERGVPFEVITVLTADSLDYPDELFDFYQANEIGSVGFNVEEIEGPHTASSLQRAGTPERFRRFLTRFLTLARSADPPLRVRELETSAAALLGARCSGPSVRTQENKPWAIVNVDCEGNFSTYSPELLGVSSPRHGGFTLGNVTTHTLEAVQASARLRQLEDEIGRGVEMCRESCAYFPFCGGGPPANKFFENGTFASTETLFCRLHKKVCLDITLALLERDAKDAGAVPQTESAPQLERAPA
ncbi:MAG TPA: cyclophane-forming radical SAM/SPASM peptide maturase GrrM/OscB [Gemmataceae bacterium]|nr:cyclophane-forming radical SAM/SPASM peptide maturase GrrM/OscB [Gemmataceae bacterium]